jgi:hypothetical protein
MFYNLLCAEESASFQQLSASLHQFKTLWKVTRHESLADDPHVARRREYLFSRQGMFFKKKKGIRYVVLFSTANANFLSNAELWKGFTSRS